MSVSFSHTLPGEHVYDGSLFFGYSPPDILDAVKEFEVREDDIFIITYPKAGELTVVNFLILPSFLPSYL